MRILTIAALIATVGSTAMAGWSANMPAHLRSGEVFAQLQKDEAEATAKAVKSANNGKGILLRDGAQWNGPNRTVNYFDQLIDHKDPSKGTFKQRYWIDLSNYTDNVAMLHIGGEGPMSSSPSGYDALYGLSIGAGLLTLEHRYYGDSYPAPLTDQATLRTLSVENALADLARFRDFAVQSLFGGRDLVWFCVGGSYPGALSAWLRQTYPDKFAAAWSSSGVVFPRFDFYDFDSAILRVIPPTCANAIRNVFTLFEQMWDNDRETLLAIFGTPSYFTKQDMAWMIADGSAMGVQYGRKYEMCSVLTTPSANPLQVYADYIRKIWGNSFTSNCYYSTECLSNPKFVDTWGPGTYCWVFQTCYEMAYWQSGYPGSLRPAKLIDTDYYMQQCRTAWWPDILPNIYQMNRKYGGLTPSTANVIATQGSDDPWLYAGINVSPNSEYPVALAQCDNCGHCIDLHMPTDKDHPSLVQQRIDIAGNLTKWIREAQQSMTRD